MRIVAGKFKGRRLVNFTASHLRPTTDRIKESIFNTLQGDVDGARVLDLFSGTGNLSFESISRGAAEVVAVEKQARSVSIIRENQTLLGIKAGFRVEAKDVRTFLKKYEGEPFDIILIDPPFTEKMGHEVMEAVAASKVFKESTHIVIETSKHERLDASYPPLGRTNHKDYGDKFVSFFYVGATDTQGDD